ncbi:helix-turn-helix domain-containing protein [Parasphingorhabdus pacifica]
MQGQGSDVRELLDETWRKRQQNADDRQLAQTRDVPTRVASALLRWAKEFGRTTEQGLLMRGLSQKDIAQAVCASEKTVEAVLGDLRNAGLLRTERLRYWLPAPHALEARVTGDSF